MDSKLTSSDYALVEGVEPYKSYIKTILGKLRIFVLSPFSGDVEEVILFGDPRDKNKEGAIIDLYDAKADMFFRKRNARSLELGDIIEYKREEVFVSEEESVNALSDEELRGLLDSKFLALQNKVNRMTSVAPMFRLIQLAKEMEKSEKIIKFLEGKLAELQEAEYSESENREEIN